MTLSGSHYAKLGIVILVIQTGYLGLRAHRRLAEGAAAVKEQSWNTSPQLLRYQGLSRQPSCVSDGW